MKLTEVYDSLFEGKAYWNPNTLEVIYWDSQYDEEHYSLESVGCLTFTLSKIDISKLRNASGLWDTIPSYNDSDIRRCEAVTKIVEEKWLIIDDIISLDILKRMLNCQ